MPRRPLFEEHYNNWLIKVFFVIPSKPGKLNYGYHASIGDLEVESIGLPSSKAALRHAGKIIALYS